MTKDNGHGDDLLLTARPLFSDFPTSCGQPIFKVAGIKISSHRPYLRFLLPLVSLINSILTVG